MHFVSGILATLGAVALGIAALIWSDRRNDTMGCITPFILLFAPAGIVLLALAIIAWLL